MRWRYSCGKSLALISVCLLALLPQCVTRSAVDPVIYAPQEHCDLERMSLRSDLQDHQWIRVRDARALVAANKECGQYTVEVLRKNTAAARINRPDGLGEDSQEMGLGALIGFLIGLVVAL